MKKIIKIIHIDFDIPRRMIGIHVSNFPLKLSGRTELANLKKFRIKFDQIEIFRIEFTQVQ